MARDLDSWERVTLRYPLVIAVIAALIMGLAGVLLGYPAVAVVVLAVAMGAVVAIGLTIKRRRHSGYG